MSATLFTAGKFREFYPTGITGSAAPLSGGLLYAYIAGTSTPKDTYTDQSGTVANTNPVVLDSNGEANVWITGSYKFVLTDSVGNQLWTEDNVADTLFSAAFSATSTTSLTIGTGSKTFITQSGKSFVVGQYLIAASNANPANYMAGQITSYIGQTLVLNITNTSGSGTFADWNLSLTGIGATDQTLQFTDNTVNNASTSQHGFQPKLSGVATQYLSGAGNYLALPVLMDQVFTASGSFTTPAGTTAATVYKAIITGAGGGGGSTGTGTLSVGGGGASGQTSIQYFTGIASGTVISVTIGAGGSAGSAGGSSSMGSPVNITSQGGAFGTGSSTSAINSAIGGAGTYTVSGASMDLQGSPGGTGLGTSSVSCAGGNGGGGYWGGGGQGGVSTTSTGVNGSNGQSFGAGAGGASGTSKTGGAGFAGVVVIEWMQ